MKISGVGCSLIDNLYNYISFCDDRFRKYLSRQPGDGGLEPGKLVFTRELEDFASEPFPKILKTITSGKKPDLQNLGGPGLVPLIHLSQILNDPDVTIHFTAATGNDNNGAILLEKLKTLQFDTSHFIKSSKPTAFTDVLSDPRFNDGAGERTFINNIGAAEDITPESLPDDFFDAAIVAFGGTALVPNIHDNLLELCKKAKQQGCFTVVNTVYDFRNEKRNPGKKWPLGSSDDTYQYIDLLIIDHEEALKLSGKRSLDEAAEFFIQQKTASFLISNGAEPLYAFSDGSYFKKLPLSKFPVSARILKELSIAEKPLGDTTGCGDNFVGGAIYAIVEQRLQRRNPDFRQVIAWAVASGGFTTFYTGGTYWEKQKGEKKKIVSTYVEDYLKQIG